MLFGYLSLGGAALIPVILTAVLNGAEKNGRFHGLSYIKKQILFGFLFGAVAIIGTEWGIRLNGFTVNCRDAAPLCAGLFFGGPAGIIAGCIGGLERWIAVSWGAGAYTRLACTVGTVLAGIAGALVRKHIFENRRPRLLLAFACAFFVEALHQSLVFFTHTDDAARAAEVVTACAPAMLIANAFSVLFAGAAAALQDGTLFIRRSERPTVSIQVVRRLFIAVTIAFLFTNAFSMLLQTTIADEDAEAQLSRSLSELSALLKEGREPSSALAAELSFTDYEKTILIFDAEGNLTASNLTASEKELQSLLAKPAGEYATCRLGKKNYRFLSAQYTDAAGNSGLAAVAFPAAEVYSSRNISTLATCFVQLFIYGILFAEIYLGLKNTVLNPIVRTKESLRAITEGQKGIRVNERRSEEFSRLSDDINGTVDALEALAAAEKARNEKDLQLAREIQLTALPGVFPAFPARKDLDIYAVTRPAKEVGGDFYDFYFTEDGRFCFLAADVSGKGIPAAMFMMRAKTQLKSLAETGTDIGEVFRRGNLALCERNEADMFVTAFMAEADMKTGEVSYVNAGHNYPAVRHRGEPFTFLKSRPSFVLGGMEFTRFKKEAFRLLPGDRVVLYTDGVTEAINPQNEEFGEERLLSVLNENSALAPEALAKKITEAVDTFAGDAAQFDDMTLLVFDYLGGGAEG